MFDIPMILLIVPLVFQMSVVSAFVIAPKFKNGGLFHRTFRCQRFRSTECYGSATIAVIGGGASGIFSAIAAAENLQAKKRNRKDGPHHKVIVLEATSKTLSKVKISGGGRCNVLHDTSKPVSELLRGYPRGRKELNGVLQTRFTPTTARAWFEDRGVELKTEPDGRMFPTTDSSQTIIDTLLKAAEDADVRIWQRCKVESIQFIPYPSENVESDGNTNHTGRFCVAFQTKGEGNDNNAKAVHQELFFDAVILATGSVPAGYKLAQGLGHTVVPTVPSLFTLNAAKEEIQNEDGLLHGLSGVSVPFAQVSFRVPEKKKPLITQEGPLLITHHGLSGPAVLRLSAFGARDLAEYKYKGALRVQWAPQLGTTDEIFEELWKLTTMRPRKQVANQCPFLLSGGSGSDDNNHNANDTDETKTTRAIPRRLWFSMAKKAGFEETQTWGTASKKLVRKLAMQINECDIPISGKGTFKEEFVTAGGISLKEIDMKNMESKKNCPGLFFCGELIDVDGVTGGYNFLNCWSTGFVAGNSAADFVLPITSPTS